MTKGAEIQINLYYRNTIFGVLLLKLEELGNIQVSTELFIQKLEAYLFQMFKNSPNFNFPFYFQIVVNILVLLFFFFFILHEILIIRNISYYIVFSSNRHTNTRM